MKVRSCTAFIKWATFSRTTSYFLRKLHKKPFFSNLSHLAQTQSTQSFKNEIKTRKKRGLIPFLIKKKELKLFFFQVLISFLETFSRSFLGRMAVV